MKRFRISLRYYRSVAPACWAVTAGCAFVLGRWQSAGAIPLSIFFKLLTLLLLLYFAAAFRPREFYYYYNFGISKARLWGTVAAVDLAIFSAAIALTFNLFAK